MSLEGKWLTSPSKLGLSSSGSHVLVHALGSGVDFNVDRRSTEALKKGEEGKRDGSVRDSMKIERSRL